ncbi:MAG TPA: PAS domain S-box protein [Terriglobales bacterium]|nr:PAS domain S-box protein [Terriglobales bacterium]
MRTWASDFRQPVINYAVATALCGAALLLWWVSPEMHEAPFVLFIAAVIVAARFLGFGPGIFSAVLSLLFIDYVVFEPHFAWSLSRTNLEQLFVFLVVSVLASGLARQKSRADIRAEQAHRQMVAIVESSEHAIFSKNLDGVITNWNPGAERLYGYRGDEVIGKNVSILAPPEQPDELPQIIEKLRRGEHIQHYMTERVRKDGTRVNVYLSVSPIRGPGGKVVGASAIAQDLTAQQKAEEALRKNEKLATAGRLATAIAHEINNPLEAIANLLYLARRDKSKSDEYLDMAEKEVLRVVNIAQQTLGFVREAASAAPLDVSSVLEEVLNLYARKLSAKKIRVEKKFEPGIEIRGFSGELRQVFSNLLANAIEAMPEQGRLRLRVERGHQWSNSGRPGVRVTVADNGHGVAPQDVMHLFEPFFTRKKEGGTGLGLWLTYNIVQKHGGSIRLRSTTQPGRCGTVFRVFLPLTIEPSETAPGR